MVAGLPAFVLQQAALQPAAYRPGPLERRINACLRALKSDTEEAARNQLQMRPDLLPGVLSTLLIGVSGFFRDEQAFAALRNGVMPALQQCRGELKVWSVGCSTGAELYSVAILLAEAGLLQHARLLGTDCRADALAHAARGVFADSEVAALGPAVRRRYFERARSSWRIAADLRQRTRWLRADATRTEPPGSWHLVLCRNLMIYLQHSAAAALFQRLEQALEPGGFLVLGKAERPPPALGLTAIGRCVYRKRR